MRGFVRYPILINHSSTSQLPIAARETSERSVSGRFDAQRSSLLLWHSLSALFPLRGHWSPAPRSASAHPVFCTHIRWS